MKGKKPLAVTLSTTMTVSSMCLTAFADEVANVDRQNRQNAQYYLAVPRGCDSHNYEIKADYIYKNQTELTDNPNLNNNDD